jgi:hypothetical protein
MGMSQENNIHQDTWRGWGDQAWLDDGGEKDLELGKKPTLNTWNHIVLTYDSSYLGLYVNGVKEQEEAVSDSLKTMETPLIIVSVRTD